MDDRERHRRLERLFADHAAAVRAYARRRVAAQSADDIVSDVFVVAWRRLEDVPADALPWLLACARRSVANQRRSERRRSALAQRLRWERPGASSDAAARDRTLGDALAALPVGDREVLMLVAWEGLDHGRAAVAMGCSQRAFAMRLHRARRRLAALMKHADADSPEAMEAVR